MKTRDLHSRISDAFIPYQKDWEDWKLSDYCFLQYREIVATELFLRTGNLKEVARSIRKSEGTAKERIRTSLIRLESSLPLFTQWKRIKQTEQENDLLQLPIKGLPLSIGLRNRLSSLGETLEEILFHHDYASIAQTRGMGNLRLAEFTQLLQTHNLQDQLRGYVFELENPTIRLNV
jgi:hypothetical protein